MTTRQHADAIDGVFFADAPDGYVALALYVRGHRIIRIEIADALYTPSWRVWLRQLAVHREKKPLKLVT